MAFKRIADFFLLEMDRVLVRKRLRLDWMLNLIEYRSVGAMETVRYRLKLGRIFSIVSF